MSIAPLSIPSPPVDWQIPLTIPLGWLHAVLPFVPETQAIQVHSYALVILLGIVLATLWVNRRLTRRGGEPWVVLDVILWAIPLGLVGARAWHVATHPGDFFFPGNDAWALFTNGQVNPQSVYAIWEGGNAIFGSLIGGAIGAWIGCRLAGLRFWSFADALAPAILLAQVLGRLGNYVNQELFGLPTDLPWGLAINDPKAAIPVGLPADTLFHPTFLYEMIWNTIGIVLLVWAERTFRLQWGKLWALYMVWYGLGRIWLESIRIDPSEYILGIRSNIWGAIAVLVLGIVLFIVQSRRHPGAEPGLYLPGRQWVAEGAVDSTDTYSDSDFPGDDAAPASGEHATSGARPTSS